MFMEYGEEERREQRGQSVSQHPARTAASQELWALSLSGCFIALIWSRAWAEMTRALKGRVRVKGKERKGKPLYLE